MSHNIHEPNHVGECIFCGKHVGKSYKMASSAQDNPTDTNQASEDELRAEILTEFKQVHRLAPADYTENCTNVVMSIIRTEKLKLLAEVRERVVGSLEPQTENGLLPDRVDRRNQLRTEQLKELTKLEAEL